MSGIVENGVLKQYEGRDYEFSFPDETIECDDYLFRGKKLLQKVHLNNGLKKLGAGTFWGCEALAELILPASISSIGHSCFEHCKSLRSIVIPDGVTRIEDSTFYGCSALEEISLPATIEHIGERAFNNCSQLQVIHFQSVPKTIAHDAFSGCYKLFQDKGAIVIGNTIYGYTGTDGNLVIPDNVTQIVEGAFWGNKSLVSVQIPGSIRCIPIRAFMECSNLREVVIGEGVLELQWLAFNYCKSLEAITIPDTVSNIGSSVFQNCSQLREIKLPNGIQDISSDLFSGCKSLKYIAIPQSVRNICHGAFSGTGLIELNTSNIAFIDSNAFSWSAIERIVLRKPIKSITAGMLDRCYSLRYLYIDESIDEIEGWRDEFAEQTNIPYLHISSKLAKGLSDTNRLNAADTFFSSITEYSDNAKKDWYTYVKRCKIRLLKGCISEKRISLFKHILDIVTLSESNVEELRSELTDASPSDFEVILSNGSIAPKKATKSRSGSSVITQILNSIPRSASKIKKIFALEAGILFGTEEELAQIIAKYMEFEFLKEAIILAVQIRNPQKLQTILQLKSTYSYGSYASLKAKFGNLIDERLEDHIVRSVDEEFRNFSAITSFVYDITQVQLDAQNVRVEATDLVTMINLVVDSNANVIKSRFLHSAIMFGKYELAASLIKAGYIIERSLLPQDVGYQLSRKIVHMSAEHAVTCFSQYASWSDEEKVKLDDSCIYTSGSPFEDSEVFRVVCAGFDISRFSKKKLFDFAVRLADSKNVELLVDRGIVHLNKPLLAEAIKVARSSNCTACCQYLTYLFEEKYGTFVSTEQADKSPTALELLKKEWSYKVEDGEITIKSYKGHHNQVVIPSMIGGKPVTNIDYDAFSPEAPRTPANIKANRMAITTIELPKHFKGFTSELWYRDRSQFGPAFRSFIIPNGSNLYSVELLAELLSLADVDNIESCGEYHIVNSVVYDRSLSIAIGVLKSNALTTFSLPSSVRWVASGFWNNFTSLKQIKISSQLESYGNKSYSRWWNGFSGMKNLHTITLEGVDVFPKGIVDYCDSIEEIIIAEGIREIPQFAFNSCKSLIRLFIPRSCVIIGDHALPRVIERSHYGLVAESHYPKEFAIYCYRDSYAEQYAKEEDAPIVYI